jgi:hypothetical protein
LQESGEDLEVLAVCVLSLFRDQLLTFSRAAPSPNQSLRSSTTAKIQESSSGVREDWLETDQLKLFTERLQPQQWLGPSNIAWVRLSVPEESP